MGLGPGWGFAPGFQGGIGDTSWAHDISCLHISRTTPVQPLVPSEDVKVRPFKVLDLGLLRLSWHSFLE